jgi:hypothetical protein
LTAANGENCAPKRTHTRQQERRKPLQIKHLWSIAAAFSS